MAAKLNCLSLPCSRQCCAGFESAVARMKDEKNAVEDIANEALNLLWNLW